MDTEIIQPGDQVFVFDRDAEITLTDTAGGVLLTVDGPHGHGEVLLLGVTSNDPWGDWLFWG